MVWVMAGIALAKGISSLVQGNKQAKAAKKAGRESAALIRKETTETVRRMDRDNKYILGESKAMSAAGGIHDTGSTYDYRKSLEEEMTRAIDWTQQAGESRAKQAYKSGQYVASSAKSAGISGGLDSASKIYGLGSEAGWWGS